MLAFLLAFIVIYAIVSLLINLLDHVVRFPVLRMFDWLPGGLCGLIRGSVIAVLLLTLLPSIVSLFNSELTQTLISGSTLYSYVTQLDFLHVGKMITQLIG